MNRRQSSGWIRHTATADEAGRTVEEILRGPLEVSGRMIQRLTRSRGILLNNRAPHLSRKVREGDVVAARITASEEATLSPVAMALTILYEDDDLLVVEKPAGLLVHPTSPKHTRTLAHGLAHHFRDQGEDAKVRPVHRLDRETSGLLLVARSAFAHQHLDRQLRERELTREYLALVDGLVPDDSGVIDLPLGKDPKNPTRRVVRADGERALTQYRVVTRSGGKTLLKLRLDTGRTHQIRVHLSHLGYPVVGDGLYGSPSGLNRLALHSSHLSFRHPRTNEPRSFESGLPGELHRLLDEDEGNGG